MKSLRQVNLHPFFLALDSCVPVRLQGPLSASGTGRVEIFYNGRWGTVCDDSWDLDDARVVCRQLGFKSAISALQGSDVPDGSGTIWLDEVSCGGYEASLFSCSHDGWGDEDCDHSEDAGVKCTPTGEQLYYFNISYERNMPHFTFILHA